MKKMKQAVLINIYSIYNFFKLKNLNTLFTFTAGRGESYTNKST